MLHVEDETTSPTTAESRRKKNGRRLRYLFPAHMRHLLDFDHQGLYSTTEYDIARTMSNIMANACWIHSKRHASKLDMVDGTAGIGGNSFAFAGVFRRVHALELDYQRWEMLQSNTRNLELHRSIDCIHGNFITYLESGMFRSMRTFFLDPPWGGLAYKRKTQLQLQLSGVPLHTILDWMPDDYTVCGLKVPYNFALRHLVDHLPPHISLRWVSRFKHIWLLVLCISPRQTDALGVVSGGAAAPRFSAPAAFSVSRGSARSFPAAGADGDNSAASC